MAPNKRYLDTDSFPHLKDGQSELAQVLQLPAPQATLEVIVSLLSHTYHLCSVETGYPLSLLGRAWAWPWLIKNSVTFSSYLSR